MVLAIRGSVFSTPVAGSTGSPLSYATVKVALDIGVEPEWTIYTNGSGLFKIELTSEEIERIFGARRHRELVFKVYALSSSGTTGGGGIFLGCQTSSISRATLRGTNSVSLTASPSYSLTSGVPNYAVSGYVVDADGTPQAEVDVVVYKKELRSETSLGTGTTDSDGRFLVRYTGTAGGHDDGPDFSIRVATDDMTVSATTDHICNPPSDLTVRLVQGNAEYRGPSDFDLDVATISPLLDTATLDELDVADVEFLMCRTQHDSGTLATLVRAHALADRYSLPAAAFAAFSHAGIPLSTNVITGLSAGEIESAIDQAVAANVVPASLADDKATITAALAAARIDRLVPAIDPESTTLGAILVAASLTPGLPRQFAELYVAHSGTAEQFWTALRAHEDFEDFVDKIQFTLQVGALTANYPPLVKLLHEKRDGTEFARAAELAQFTAENWIAFLAEEVDSSEVGTPPGVAGADSTARRANYAGAIAKMVEDLYPSAHLVYRLPQSAVTTQVEDIAGFVVKNPGFSFQRTNISEFFPTATGLPIEPEDQEALRQDLLRVQRVSAITPRSTRTAASTALLTAGVTSASQIQRMGFAAFKTKLGVSVDASTLRATFEKADRVASTALHAFMHTRKETHFPLMDVLTSPGCGDVDLEALFGNLDYCACKHCDSVYGPAAYFVDIMQFVRERDIAENTFDVLVTRRPELPNILLNCENSNTPLPTIDLVLETLERHVRVPLGLEETVYEASSDWPQTTWSASDLIARPEHVDDQVYEELAKHTVAYFPHSLPFDLPLEEARAYLRSLGTSRVALQDALEWFSALDEDLVFRVDERLGLSLGQGEILRTAEDLHEFWGFTSDVGWVAEINFVERFLERSGLDLPGLQGLLRTRLLDGIKIDYDEPCTLKDARLVNDSDPPEAGLDNARLKQLKIFLRLRSALGWSVAELDATLFTLNTWFSNPTTDLEKIARFVRVRQRFPRLPHGEVLSWFGMLDQHVYNEREPSYYDMVVLPRRRDIVFSTLDESTPFSAVHGDLLGILQTDDAGLNAAYAATGLTDESTVNHTRLSDLYRVASIARAVGLAIPDLVALTSYTALLNGSPSPFVGTADAPVRALIDVAEAVKRSGFTVPELDWILRNQNEAKFGASDLDVSRALIGLITALQKAEADHNQILPQDLIALDRVEKLLAGPLPAGKVAEAMEFIRKETDAPDPAALRSELFFFLTDNASAAYVEFGKAFDVAETPENRAEVLELELAPWLRRIKLERLVVQQLATTLSLETADCDLLLRTYKPDTTALESLTADAFFASTSFDVNTDGPNVKEPGFPKTFLERTNVSPRVTMYVGLRKVALVASTFRFAPGLLRWLLVHKADPGVQLLDLTALPTDGATDQDVYDAYAGWDWLRRAIRVRDQILQDPSALTLLLDLFFRPAFNKELALKTLANATGWDVATLVAFEAAEAVTQLDLKGLGPVEAFDATFRLAARLGVQPETVRTWAKDVSVDATDAAAIRGAAEAKFGPSAWPSVAQPIRDRLRQRQRDALVDLLVHNTSGVNDHEDLFGTLLMDVDIACCNRTTRLLFATGAVQLFMQRALMGLESEHEIELSEDDAVDWEWMKRYRVWEANRKIFLYPENWVQPELRGDKTPLFKKLEQEIAQSEADDASIEKAYVSYLEGLNEVARLDVCGMYHELEKDSIVIVDRMHVFACTHGNPFKVFYRRREDDAYWTAWDELPFSVESRSLLPVVANRRLMLIWPKIETRAEEPATNTLDQNAPPTKPQMKRHIRLMWSEYKDGEWSAVRTSEGSLKIGLIDYTDAGPEGRHPNWDVFFTSEVKSGAIEIRVSSLPHVLQVQPEGYFVYESCHGRFEVVKSHESPQDAFGSKSLSSGFPVPYPTMIRSQGFGSFYLGEVASENYLRMPAGPSYSANIIGIDWTQGGFKINIPRQEHILNGGRPFVYTDPETTLYLRLTDGDPSDNDPDSVGLASTSGLSLLPYFAYTEGKVAVEPLPSNAAVQKQLVGGDSPATEQSLPAPGLPTDTAFPTIKHRVALFYHPYTCDFLEQVRRFGVPGLLDVATVDETSSLLHQKAENEECPADHFDATTDVWKPVPNEDIDFLYGRAYSVYNWELFFHIPMYIADRLMAERRFAEAQRWLGYIFNPIRTPTLIEETDCKHYWRIKPFRELSANMSIAALLEVLQYNGSDAKLKDRKDALVGEIEQWRKNPFQPHHVAQLRQTAYMRAVVMKYLDNLIAWGDDLFRQDTRESTQEAVQLYILALQILGKRPRKIEGDERPDKSYDEAHEIDQFSNFLVELENSVLGFGGKDAQIPLDPVAQANHQFNNPDHYQLAYAIPSNPESLLRGGPRSSAIPPKRFDPIQTGETQLYFCIPPNDKLLGYWDTVADRLFKLRNCLNLEGVRRDLALFDPPIDPGLLAKAVAQGIDIGTAVSNLYAPLPHYRFLPHLGIAKDFAAQVSSLGGALLQALEKRDAEALAVLRGGHEVSLLKVVRQVKETAIKEAEGNIEALEKGRAVTVHREKYYKSREFMIPLEKEERDMTKNANIVELLGGALHTAAGIAGIVPQFTVGVSGYAGTPVAKATMGGTQAQGILNAAGTALGVAAGAMHRHAGILGQKASYTRRQEEWTHQAELAALELKQIDAQITAAEIRKAMAEYELANHDKQIEQSAEALEVMRSKFTNAELYSWMAAEISKVYHLAYQLAIDLARRAERCYRYELAVTDGNDFVQFGHWDNRRQGLLAGERLQHDLRRMEAAYYQNNRREYELTKRVSLASLDPVALIALRKTGACHFNLPSILFNLDHASHYLRRIKLVGVSIPAVTGPYTNIGVTLTYETGKIRREPGEAPTEDLGAAQSVAISVSQEDTGLFEPNLRDERYLPFEGRALENSNWRLELPKVVRQFDYETISDVILTVRYTAREGGSTTAGVVGDLETALDSITRDEPMHGTGQVQAFSARAEFPEAWRAFVAGGNNDGETTLALDLTEQRFPHPQVPPGGDRSIEFVAVFVRWPADDSIAPAPGGPVFVDAELKPPLPGEAIELEFAAYKTNDPLPDGASNYNYLWFDVTEPGLGKALGTWTLDVPNGWPTNQAPEDIIIVVGHKVT